MKIVIAYILLITVKYLFATIIAWSIIWAFNLEYNIWAVGLVLFIILNIIESLVLKRKKTIDEQWNEMTRNKMNAAIAAEKTSLYMREPIMETYIDINHLWHMVKEIQKMDLKITKENEKAMRWLGWLQAMVVEHGNANLEDMKKINKEA